MAEIMTDAQLLAEFAQTRSQEAFAGMVRRHIALVHGTARRLVGDEHLAQDIAQAAFVVLAKKARSVDARHLPGWLVNTTRLAAKEAQRSKLCREKHEWRAAQMRSSRIASPADDEPTVGQLTPLLDEAMSHLGEADRTAVVMRFMQGLSFAEVGAAMGSSEEAARKRVVRAVEKLRKALVKGGVAPSAGGLMVILSAHQAQAAPAGMAEAVSGAAAAGGKGASAILAKGVMKMMTLAKVKVVALLIGVALVAGGVMTVAGETGAVPASAAGGQPAAATPKAPEWQAQLNQVYGLANGEAVKRIRPPFAPARTAFWKATDPRRPGDNTTPPDQMVFVWNGQVGYAGQGWGQVDPLRMVLQTVMGWNTGDFEGPADLLAKSVPGDWVVRAGATEQEKVAGLLAILRRDVDPAITLQKQEQSGRETIVARGKFEYQPHVDASGGNQVILYSDPYVAEDGGGGGAGTLAQFLNVMGNCAGVQVVDQVDRDRPEMVSWHTLGSCWLSQRPKDPNRSKKLDSLLRNVAAQTGLSLTREKQKANVWVVGRKGK